MFFRKLVLLEQHRIWVATDGTEGKQADLQDLNLVGRAFWRADLRRALLDRSNLAGWPEKSVAAEFEGIQKLGLFMPGGARPAHCVSVAKFAAVARSGAKGGLEKDKGHRGRPNRSLR